MALVKCVSVTGAVVMCFVLHLCLVKCDDKVPDSARFDCFLEDTNLTKATCDARGCTFQLSENKKAPSCFYPKDYDGGYKVVGEQQATSLGFRLNLKRRSTRSVYGTDIEDIAVDVEFQTNNRIRFKLFDPKNKRYEVPVDFAKVSEKASNVNYNVEYKKEPFSLQITRKDTGTVIWDSSVGVLRFSDQYLQISTRTPSSNVYGFGEQEHSAFLHSMDWRTLPLFTRDQFPFNKGNLYGMHALYTCLENDSNAHGVYLLNSNAMDVDLQPSPAITYRTIGGVLDFYVFLGSSPEDVVKQYTELIGRTFIPPYWSLGFQLCRWGYNSLKKVQEVVGGMQKYDIPQDVQYGDIDYMIRQLDFTYDPVTYKGLPDFVRSIKKDGLRYIIILDPAIGANETQPYRPYDLGNNLDIWIKDEQGKPLFGKVWPTLENVTVNNSLPWDEITRLYRQYATFPDFFHPDIDKYWGVLIKDFHKIIEFDGLWIDMNEPANFVKGSVTGCKNNKLNYPPYKPRIVGDVMADKTLCMSAIQANAKHYDVHSLYGWSQTKSTLKAAREATGKRSLVISRSTFASSGKQAGHWLGDNKASWDQMHTSIIGMMEFNLFGIPYIGADICGFFDHPTPELCQRWMQLGAFYPFSRNHNGFGNKDQDPASFGPEFAAAARKVLRTRYKLLPYLYTLFYESHLDGSTVVRPIMHEFVLEKETWKLDKQFLWGPALLISPVLEKGKTSTTAYFPKDRWFDYYTGAEIADVRKGKFSSLDAPLDHINLHVRGGYIIPTQEPANNTAFSRKNPMGVIAALGDDGKASGQLFWDDGESVDTYENGKYLLIQFSATQSGLTMTVKKGGITLESPLNWGVVLVYGLDADITARSLKVNGKDMAEKGSYDKETKVFRISGIALDVTESHKITWVATKSAGRKYAADLLFVTVITTIACLCLIGGNKVLV